MILPVLGNLKRNPRSCVCATLSVHIIITTTMDVFECNTVEETCITALVISVTHRSVRILSWFKSAQRLTQFHQGYSSYGGYLNK